MTKEILSEPQAKLIVQRAMAETARARENSRENLTAVEEAKGINIPQNDEAKIQLLQEKARKGTLLERQAAIFELAKLTRAETKRKEELPPGWREEKDPYSNNYYYINNNGMVSFNKPQGGGFLKKRKSKKKRKLKKRKSKKRKSKKRKSKKRKSKKKKIKKRKSKEKIKK